MVCAVQLSALQLGLLEASLHKIGQPKPSCRTAIIMNTIILASASPRRKEILERLHIPFEVCEPMVDETKYAGSPPGIQVTQLASDKVFAAREQLSKSAIQMGLSDSISQVAGQPQSGEKMYGWIAGFDTLVELGGRILGKPRDREEAGYMIGSLSGKTHSVYTGIALLSGAARKLDVRFAKSRVTFARMSTEDISFYLDTGEWEGVAGAYRIQERASFFIERIKGSYSNIVGLPISLFYVMLRDANYPFS
jgi:septum formation protein